MGTARGLVGCKIVPFTHLVELLACTAACCGGTVVTVVGSDTIVVGNLQFPLCLLESRSVVRERSLSLDGVRSRRVRSHRLRRWESRPRSRLRERSLLRESLFAAVRWVSRATL